MIIAKKILFLIMLFHFATELVFSQEMKKQDAVFVEYDIPFGQADSWDLIGFGVNSPKILEFDLYQPSEMDSEKLYPFVILINPKNSPQIVRC